MGKEVPDWQTFIRCNGGCLIIRHLKSGLAENLEIPWPTSPAIPCDMENRTRHMDAGSRRKKSGQGWKT